MEKVSELLINKVGDMIETSIVMLPNYLSAGIVLIIFYILARMAKKASYKVLGRFSNNETLNTVIITFAYITVIAIGVFSTLSILKLEKTVTSLLAGAGILGLALGIAFQDIFANLMSGIIMAFRQPIREGDLIETKGYMGHVVLINLRNTVVETFEGQHVIVPNKDVFQTPIVNYSVSGKRRVDLMVHVPYRADLDYIQSVMEEALGTLYFLNKERDVSVIYWRFGSYAIECVARFWINLKEPSQPGYLEARSMGLKVIQQAFVTHNIKVPFPVRSLDFEAEGGKSLSDLPPINYNVVNKPKH